MIQYSKKLVTNIAILVIGMDDVDIPLLDCILVLS